MIQIGETILQPPPDQLPAWVKTEGDILQWLFEQSGAPYETKWHTEGPLPDGSRIWVRVE